MSAIVLEGKSWSRQIEVELTVRVAAIKKKSHDVTPILATIPVGDDRADVTYVRMKGSACE